MRARHLGMAVAVLGLSTAACAAGGTRAAVPAPARPAASAGTPAAITSGLFGTGCGRVPAAGTSGLAGLAAAVVVTAASRDPRLSELVHAIRVAGLTTKLNAARSITVFAPDNSAFARLGSGNLSTLLASKADLRRVLEYHVVAGRRTPADLVSGATVRTLLGTTVRPFRSGRGYRINNANVVCGNIRTANATVYIIDRVLIP
jgi:uncharacterized surface protein with fasciclin (FAS1) repeats